MVKTNYTDGTILSGAMINSDYKDLLGKIVIPSNIHGFSFGSDGMIGSNINHFPDSMKCIGITLTTTGTFIMSLLNIDSSYLFHMLPAFLILACGFGISFVAITVAATSGIPGEEAGLASGLINPSQQIGGALGLAILAVISANATTSALASGETLEMASMLGYQRAFLTASGLMFLALLIAIFVIQTPKTSNFKN